MRNHKRVEGWQEKLFTMIEAHRALTFEWGSTDCVTFVARCVDVQLGTEYGRETSRMYPRSDLGAMRYGDLEYLVTSFLGYEPVGWGSCGMGDVVLIDSDGSKALTISDGVQLVGMGPNGLGFPAWSQAIKGWRLET